MVRFHFVQKARPMLNSWNSHTNTAWSVQLIFSFFEKKSSVIFVSCVIFSFFFENCEWHSILIKAKRIANPFNLEKLFSLLLLLLILFLFTNIHSLTIHFKQFTVFANGIWCVCVCMKLIKRTYGIGPMEKKIKAATTTIKSMELLKNLIIKPKKKKQPKSKNTNLYSEWY